MRETLQYLAILGSHGHIFLSDGALDGQLPSCAKVLPVEVVLSVLLGARHSGGRFPVCVRPVVAGRAVQPHVQGVGTALADGERAEIDRHLELSDAGLGQVARDGGGQQIHITDRRRRIRQAHVGDSAQGHGDRVGPVVRDLELLVLGLTRPQVVERCLERVGVVGIAQRDRHVAAVALHRPCLGVGVVGAGVAPGHGDTRPADGGDDANGDERLLQLATGHDWPLPAISRTHRTISLRAQTVCTICVTHKDHHTL